ncbi:oxidoreductase [Oceanobacillus picturae]|uniref:Oxidoreductase n=1 Tax=Oceanobacillus picturae TaxID=171693 RepID=A0A0U9H2X6_9BACI|nr:Gfo/Idh/MocA family oxidoreductase [Oceanobacillus picturae]RIU94845.1 gfo/Idh/MocA family oxidoreductase [Oceanobacillus picturae]GAQ16942.1 oxidoreductase [Oceanobacillus picturae]
MLRVGVIGVGSISRYHIEQYLRHEKVQLVALCDKSTKQLQNKGELYNIKELYHDYRELIKQQHIDAVSICTWNNSHAEIAVAALEAGKHVLIEKPLSKTVEEALSVKDAVIKSGKVLQVGFVRRHGEHTKVLKKFIDKGTLGEIYYAKASYLRRLGNPGGWFSDKAKSGGGPLIDLGVHVIDICWYLMGKPKPVSVSGNTYKKLGNRSNIENLSFYKAAEYNPELNDVEDLANAIIRFENGATIMVDVSFTLHTKDNELSVKLFGENGGAEVEPELHITTEKHNTILNISPQIDDTTFDFKKAFTNEISHFVACCLEGRENIAPVDDGVQLMKILSAIYESGETGKEVYLS